MLISHKHWEIFCFRMKARDFFHLLSQHNVFTLVVSPFFKEPKTWGGGVGEGAAGNKTQRCLEFTRMEGFQLFRTTQLRD